MVGLVSNDDGLRPIRLLWLIDSLTMGGAESLVVSFARFIDTNNITFHVCSLKNLGGNPIEKELRGMGIPCVNLNAVNLRDYKAFKKLLNLFKDKNIQIIHAHLTYAGIWGTLASRVSGIPCLTTLHVQPPGGGIFNRETVRHKILCKVLNRWSSGVIMVSKALRNSYVSPGDLDPGIIQVIYNGIDPNKFNLDLKNRRLRVRQEFGFSADTKLILTVCVLRKQKGVQHLLDAVKTIIDSDSDIKFLIVGDGPYKENLLQYCTDKGLSSHVYWAGFRRDVADILGASDLFVLPSLEDAFPTVLLEAMASGLPVIASSAGGIPEIIEHDKTGILAPPGNSSLLAKEIINILRQPEKRSGLVQNARNKVIEKFSSPVWVANLVDLYKHTLGKGQNKCI